MPLAQHILHILLGGFTQCTFLESHESRSPGAELHFNSHRSYVAANWEILCKLQGENWKCQEVAHFSDWWCLRGLVFSLQDPATHCSEQYYCRALMACHSVLSSWFLVSNTCFGHGLTGPCASHWGWTGNPHCRLTAGKRSPSAKQATWHLLTLLFPGDTEDCKWCVKVHRHSLGREHNWKGVWISTFLFLFPNKQ